MSAAAVFRDRACQTMSDYAYPIGSGGIALTAVGLAASSVVATVAGLFLVAIAALVRYLYPSINVPPASPAAPLNVIPSAEALAVEPPPVSVIPLRAKTYEEQDRTFAQGFATYCNSASLDGLYQSLRLVSKEALAGRVGAELNPNEDMVKIQCNGTLYLLIRDQSSHVFNDSHSYHLLSDDVKYLKSTVLTVNEDLSTARFRGVWYRDFPRYMEVHSVFGVYNAHPDVGYWKNRNIALQEINVCVGVLALSLVVLSYVGEKIVSIHNVVSKFENGFFSQVLRESKGARTFFDFLDVSESVNARGHYLFKAQDFPPGTHLVRALVKNEHFIGVQFARKIAQINYAGPHANFLDQYGDKYSVTITWIRTHNKRGEFLPSGRQAKDGYKTTISYKDFARKYATAFPNG